MQPTQLYLELSDYYDQRGEAQSRDRFLVLAADAAYVAGDRQEAEALRQRLLTLNPHHLLKPFQSFEEAQKSRDVTDYINALRRRHPPEQVARLVETTIKKEERRESLLDRAQPLQMPAPPQRPEAVQAPHPVETFKIRQPEEPAPTVLRSRPFPPAPVQAPIQPNPGRPRPAVSPQHAPLSLPPLPLPPEPSRTQNVVSPFRPQHASLPQATVPVYQGPRLAATSGSWFCSLLFLLWLIAGVGLAIYSVGRILLPAELVPARLLPVRE
jgi:hypothetical protein